ncbi:hypothetical protein Bbelb_295260 [Branchiostoma belcheri]|nr:hypothetical protein Bbelb_295260 [Branchiostoma belcheri]
MCRRSADIALPTNFRIPTTTLDTRSLPSRSPQRSDRDGDERDVATTSSAQALQNPEGTDEAGNQRETRPDEGEVDRPCRGSAETEGEGGGHVLSAADNTPGPSTASRAPSVSSSGSSESDSESESDSTEESRTTSMRLKVIESHEKSPGHVSAMNRFDMERVPIQERPMEKVVQKMEEKKLQQMINLFRTAFYVAKQGRPYTDFPELLRLQKCNGLDVGTAYWNDKEARIFVDYISLGMKKELRSSLQESDFVAVLADGSSDAGNIEEEVIQIRYLKDNIEPTTAFVALKSLERGDAVNITDAVKSALKEDLEMGEEWKNKLAFACFDGAAVNVGHLSGVGVRLQEECPHLIVLHCCAHRLELVVKDVLKEVPYFAAVQDLFTTIYKFYHNSALNWQGLRNAGEALDILVLKPVRASGTRWLPHQERALKAVMRDFPALVQHLGHLVEHGEVGSKDSREKANGILQGVKSIKFVLFLLFLSQYLQLMSSLSKVFQDNSSTLETVYRRVENVVKTLNKLSRPEKLSRIFSEGMEERDGVVLWKGIPLQAGRPQRGRPGGLASQREEVMKDCQQIINATSHHLGRRFDVLLSHRVFSAARRVFQFSTWPQDDDDDPDDDFGDDDIRTIYQHFQHPVELKGVDLESCLREWSELKEVCRNQLSQARRAPSFSEFWMRFMRREEADSDYRNIFTLLRLSLSPCGGRVAEGDLTPPPMGLEDAKTEMFQALSLKRSSKLHQQDENTCSSRQEQITQLQNQLSEVNKQLKEKEASENEMKGQVAKLWNQTQADKTALHDAESSSRQLETQVEGLKGQLKEKEDRAAMLEKDLEIVRSTVSDYKAVREDLEKTRSREVDMRATLQSMTAQQEERNSTIDRLEDSLNTLKQELKEKVDQAKLAQEEQQAAKQKEKEDASKKVEELEALLEAKEKRLKTKSATIKELMEKADQERRKAEDERQKYEIAFTDVQGNETVISTLKQALEEQEATMATQDKVLESKQEEIQTFADELEDLQKKYSELLESSDVNKRELKRTISNLEHLKLNYEQADTDRKSAQEELGSVKEEKDGLQEQLKTLSERVQELERTLHSTKGEEGALQNEKDRLEVALLDSKKEVETLEQWLSETKQEFEQLKKELEDGEKDNTDKEALEDRVRQLQQDLETVQQQKEEELSQWRSERDQLVSELEKQLKALVAREKATQASLADAEEEIKTLKAEKEETQESGDRLTALQSQLDECYSTISHLEEQLKQQTSGPATRRGRRTTRSAMISEDQLRRELDTCRKQLVEEQRAKEKVSDNLDKAVRAKDKIIDELKKSNQDLQRELWAQSATEEGDGPIVFDESEIIDEEGNRKRRFPSVHLEMDVTPVVTKRKTKTTRAAGSRRGRKRKSEELVENEDPKVDTPATRTRSRKKVPKTSIKQEPVSPTPSESHVPETPEDQLPLSSLRGSKRTALSRIGDYVSNSPVAKSAKKIVEAAVGLASPTKSPVAESPPRPAEKKKRRKLYKTDISAPFECPPHQLVSTGINEPAEDAHSIVTRRLRTRTHKK